MRVVDLGQHVFEWRREAPGRDVQQLDGAHPGAAAHRDDREERPACDRLLQVVDQHGLVDHLTAEIALHQRFVLGLLDDALDQRAAMLGDPVGVGVVRRVDGTGAVAVVVLAARQQPDQPPFSIGRYSGSTFSPKASCAARRAVS